MRAVSNDLSHPLYNQDTAIPDLLGLRERRKRLGADDAMEDLAGFVEDQGVGEEGEDADQERGVCDVEAGDEDRCCCAVDFCYGQITLFTLFPVVKPKLLEARIFHH